MYTVRTLEKFIKKAVTQFPALMLTGARQVGKTTLFQHLFPDGVAYVTLDDPLVLELARRDPALFMLRFPPPVILDEIQYAPELLVQIKLAVDKNREPGQFLLTGSQQFHLMKNVAESLAGRVAVIQLSGLSRREMIGQGLAEEPFLPAPCEASDQSSLTLQELYRLIWRGAYPAISLNPEMDRDLFFSSYVQTYIQRDIRDLARVGDEMAFLRFLRAAAARTGQMLNMADMARDADVSPNTAKKWLSVLQASGIIYLLEPYHTNVTKRLVKTPKLYFLDTGLCAYLTEWSSPQTLEAGAMSGAILETWILTELLKSYWHNGRRAPFYYYRDKDCREIDLLIIRDGTVYPLELKKTASPRQRDVHHFRALDRLPLPVGQGGLICLADQSLPLTGHVQIIPVGCV